MVVFFCVKDTATVEFYTYLHTLSLHDALPIFGALVFASLFPTVATGLWFVVRAGRPGMQVVYASAKIVQFAFPALWVLTAERSAGGILGPGRARLGDRKSTRLNSSH